MSDLQSVITLDGPSGTGKGTVSQLIAKTLNWHLLDSGSLYRVLGLAAKLHAVDFSNEEALCVLAAHLDVEFKATEQNQSSRIILEGNDVTDQLRSEECGEYASIVAAIPMVRHALLARQRAFCQPPGLVTDGRDMGTVVFPNAFLKFYLEANPVVRAKRRYNQLKDKGASVIFETIMQQIVNRDKRDSSRPIAPLKPAKDAIIVDTSHMSIQQVFDALMHHINKELSLQN